MSELFKEGATITDLKYGQTIVYDGSIHGNRFDKLKERFVTDKDGYKDVPKAKVCTKKSQPKVEVVDLKEEFKAKKGKEEKRVLKNLKTN